MLINEPKLRYNGFLRTFSQIFLVVSLAVSLINWYIDPWVFFGHNTLGAYFRSDREFKASRINLYPHDALLLGPSTVALINPDDLSGYKFFNASFRGALPEEILQLLQKRANNLSDLKMIVIGIDFFMLGGQEQIQPLPDNKNFSNWLGYMLNLQLFHASTKCIQMHLQNAPQIISENGQLSLNSFIHLNRSTVIQQVINKLYGFGYSESRINALKKIKAFLDEKHLPYLIFLGPIHPELLQKIKQMPAYRVYNLVKQNLAEIFPDLTDLSESKYSNAIYFNQQDPLHFLPNTGKEFVSEMLIKYAQDRH